MKRFVRRSFLPTVCPTAQWAYFRRSLSFVFDKRRGLALYRALYRKWRPATFEDVIGQAAITDALKNQISHDKIGHAYMFTGTRGTGKTTCAKIFAKAVNCETPINGEPCCKCPTCLGIDDGSVMDVVEMDAASNNGVDDIRDLRDETAYTPSQGKYKVYIVDEVHMLSNSAFNALLKILEEPPSHVIFILATTEIHKVPATILSRCQRYDFARIPPDAIAKRLLYVASQENIQLDDAAAGLIARLADGAMRDALSILDTCAGVSSAVDEALVRRMAGVTDKSYLFDIQTAVSEKDVPKALALIAELREKSVDIKRMCDELVLHYRNLLLAGVANGSQLLTGVSAQDEQRYIEASKVVNQADALRAVKTFCEALDKMGKGTDARIELELAVFKLCGDDAPQITAQPTFKPAQPQAFNRQSVPEYIAPAQPAQQAAAPVKEQPIVEELPKQPELPSPPPLPSGIEQQEFEPWGRVIEAMHKKDMSIYANIKDTKAYYDGKRVLIDGSEFFLTFIRTNKFSVEVIKQVIGEVTGAKYAIGPYKRPQTAAQQNGDTAASTLEKLSAAGVEVVYNDK